MGFLVNKNSPNPSSVIATATADVEDEQDYLDHHDQGVDRYM